MKKNTIVSMKAGMKKTMLPKIALITLATTVIAAVLMPWQAMANNSNQFDEDAVNARIQPLARVKLAPLAAKTASGAQAVRSGEDIYRAACAACHDTGVAGAPRMGNAQAWASRIGVGLEVLTKTAVAGKGAMPPNGASDASFEELASAVAYMANNSGASFKPEQLSTTEQADNTAVNIAANAAELAEKVCFECHASGKEGAPRLDDQASWLQRASKGLDAITSTVIRGHGKMPARGGLANLTDSELKKVIAYLLKTVETN